MGSRYTKRHTENLSGSGTPILRRRRYIAHALTYGSHIRGFSGSSGYGGFCVEDFTDLRIVTIHPNGSRALPLVE